MAMRGVVLCLHGIGDHCRRNLALYEQVPHADLFKELFQANTCRRFGTAMMRVLQEDVKRL
ncbi:hypothetical protein PF005_g28415 [Phytophthora fragariae]|uniref:Uncharacterized protein n=2 Tax=Phytophthora TaxID=4783 RepID=A0A6A3VZK0_9STRA|nr:hypothetical protein PF003_g882 [Phytophthora fragariae]KAE8977144.1 hypothetical protein PR002_g25104 [Phytophthora rubi]KAE8920775.1 hypothetical protein PF009_g28937 [Phytophthora fragariae]KAE8973165.1 hypothetical protein PF011_g25362 [Phytophthora fragariae]KAE8981934.1 hypothetical protein PR001_g23861 [Phytophthora rubi]